VIRAAEARQNVVARSAVQVVVAAAPVDGVVSVLAPQLIGEIGAGQ
jgi:hypothetical protein